ncbi:hypothetical protein JW796_02900 [Candidatus Dojkabacteria bacterium]|nr:hypothetical protein [Candidatus Dojkabacteria bacterium]
MPENPAPNESDINRIHGEVGQMQIFASQISSDPGEFMGYFDGRKTKEVVLLNKVPERFIFQRDEGYAIGYNENETFGVVSVELENTRIVLIAAFGGADKQTFAYTGRVFNELLERMIRGEHSNNEQEGVLGILPTANIDTMGDISDLFKVSNVFAPLTGSPLFIGEIVVEEPGTQLPAMALKWINQFERFGITKADPDTTPGKAKELVERWSNKPPRKNPLTR